MFISWSIKVNSALLQDCLNVFLNETSNLKASGVAMLDPALSFQSLGKGIIRNTYKNGGNPLGTSLQTLHRFLSLSLHFLQPTDLLHITLFIHSLLYKLPTIFLVSLHNAI